jgi:hypothetical protein
LEFDGIGTEVNITASSPVTLEIWVKPNATSGIDALAGHDSITSNYIYWNSGDLTVNGVVFTSLDKVTDWTHIALVESGADLLCYKNGNLIQTLPGALGTYNLLGARTAGTSQYLDGKIGQVRMYSSALTQDQVRQNFNFTKPSYPNGFDGTISGATWNAGGYFDFDGLNNKVTLPSTFFKTTKILSVAVWVKFDTISQNFIGIIENVAGNVGGWALDIPSSASKLPRLQFYNGSSYSIAQGTTALTTGQWHHLCGTISGEEMKLYVNGSLEATTSYSVAISNTNQSVVIGGDGASTNYLDGQISDVKLYDKALSAAEIEAQFAIKQFDIG